MSPLPSLCAAATPTAARAVAQPTTLS